MEGIEQLGGEWMDWTREVQHRDAEVVASREKGVLTMRERALVFLDEDVSKGLRWPELEVLRAAAVFSAFLIRAATASSAVCISNSGLKESSWEF